MKTSGLPAAPTHDCEVVFTVMPQNSMDALREAAAKRNAHELEGAPVHAHRHDDSRLIDLRPGPAARRPRGRRRKEEELNVI